MCPMRHSRVHVEHSGMSWSGLPTLDPSLGGGPPVSRCGLEFVNKMAHVGMTIPWTPFPRRVRIGSRNRYLGQQMDKNPFRGPPERLAGFYHHGVSVAVASRSAWTQV